MFKDNSQQAYSISVGTSSTNQPIIETRDPTSNDIYYPIGKFWINTVDLELWYLNSQDNSTGFLQSTWLLVSQNAQATTALVGDDGVPVNPVNGEIQTLGNVVANSTHAKPLFTMNPSVNIEQFDIQVAAAIASTNINRTGLAAFNSTQFSVDANGFVTLAGGGGSPTLGLIPSSSTPPGTNPVVPNVGGNIILEGGATFSTGTQANPIRTNSLAANTIDFQIQLSGSNPVLATANNFGVSQFDSNSFTVSGGFVTLNNAGTTGAVTSLTGNTGPTVVPTAGNINVVGSGSITISGAGSTLTTQLTGLTNHAILVGAGTTTITKVGPTATAGQVLQSAGAAADPAFSTATYPSTTTVSQILYSSATNTVSGLATANRGVLTTGTTGVPVITALAADGQVIIGSTAGAPAAATLTAGAGIAITNGSNSITISTSGAGTTWTEVTGTSQAAAVNNGYIANNAGLVTITLPSTFAVGDIVRIGGKGAGLWRLSANTGDTIHFGSSDTSAGGSLTATNRYDAVEVVGITANSEWLVLSSIGNLTVA